MKIEKEGVYRTRGGEFVEVERNKGSATYPWMCRKTMYTFNNEGWHCRDGKGQCLNSLIAYVCPLQSVAPPEVHWQYRKVGRIREVGETILVGDGSDDKDNLGVPVFGDHGCEGLTVDASDCNYYLEPLDKPSPPMESVATPIPEPDALVGLYRKFDVRRTDGTSEPGGKHENCEYFVLDMIHDKFARPAIAAYAEACKADFPELADDLTNKYLKISGTPIPEPQGTAEVAFRVGDVVVDTYGSACRVFQVSIIEGGVLYDADGEAVHKCYCRHATSDERRKFFAMNPQLHSAYKPEHGDMKGWRYLEVGEQSIYGDEMHDGTRWWLAAYGPKIRNEIARRRVDADGNDILPGEASIPEGFTPWHGGDCPVPANTFVDTIHRDGKYCYQLNVSKNTEIGNDYEATDAYWRHDNGDAALDIIAYRVIEQPQPAPWKPVAGSWVNYVSQKCWYVGKAANNYAVLDYGEEFYEVDYAELSPWIDPPHAVAEFELNGDKYRAERFGDDEPVITKVEG